MAHGRATEEETMEIFDSPEELEAKMTTLIEMVRNSKHFVAFTGAGISTSAGIPDFRGPQGVWTLQDKGMEPKMEKLMEELLPTQTHMALVALQNQGLLKYVVSQNVDGLHLRSGIRPENLSELHGNTYIECCEKCHKSYLRCFSTTSNAGDDVDFSKLSMKQWPHGTGRRCDDSSCRGILRDNIINFGETLPTRPLELAEVNCQQSDLIICLGSSLTVSPACDLPKTRTEGGNLCIVNLQRTPLDDIATLRIFAKVDDVIGGLMKALDIPIPSFEPPPLSEVEERLLQQIIERKKNPKAKITGASEQKEKRETDQGEKEKGCLVM